MTTQQHRVAFVGSREFGLGGNGKVHPPVFYPRFCETLNRLGYPVELYETVQEFSGAPEGGQAAVVLVYNEERLAAGTTMSDLLLAERIAQRKFDSVHIVHPSHLGLIVSNKRTTLAVLEAAGIKVPKQGDQVRSQLLSYEIHGSGHTPRLVDAPERGKHNVEFIDTRFSAGGNEYFTSLRAMAVGDECLACFVRAKRADAESPSVHNSDTPIVSSVLNELHAQLVVPRWSAIRDLCKRAGKALGFGMFAYDLLVSRDTGEVYVCEVNIKLDEFGMRGLLGPVRSELSFRNQVSPHYADLAAHSFLQGLRNEGLWW